MRVGMYYSNNDVRVEEKLKPKIGPGELLVKVMASGICGTDVVEWYRRDRVPLVLGHEIAGEIVEAGKGAKGYKAGDRISASHHVPCGECRYCLSDHHSACETLRKTNFDPGGFSEFLRIPAINVEKSGVYKLPASVSYEEATFVEPLACAIRGQRMSWQRPGKGQTAVVIGSGISGILHIQLLRAKGFSKIIATDINYYRLKEALRFGADHGIDAKEDVPDKVKELNSGRLADFVILCAGARPAIEQAIKSLDRGGVVLIFASADEGFNMSLPMNDFFWRSERSIVSSYAANPDEHREALKLIENRKINVKDMITHRFGLAEIQKGFKLVSEARESIKVIIEPQR